jgi:hypothetical protein
LTVLHIDFETRSELSLPVCGLHRYTTHGSTQAILLAWAIDDGPPQLFQPHIDGQFCPELKDALTDPHVQKAAWNSAFERLVLRYKFGIRIPMPEWVDPMIQARYMSMPGYLEDVTKILGLTDDAKMPWGTKKDPGEAQKLITMFCEPAVAPKDTPLFGNMPAWFHDYDSDPHEWERFCAYCVQDVVAERAVMSKLRAFPLPEREREAWFIDQAINERGVYCDLALARGSAAIAEQVKKELHARIKELTKVENPNANPQLLKFVQTQGYTFSGLAKGFVSRALDGECDLTPAAREVLELRKQSAKTSDAKLETILESVCEDGRLRHQYAFMGASRTGRWSGKGDFGGAQLQNLPRPTKAVAKKLDTAIRLLQDSDYLGLSLEFENPMEAVTTALRSVFRAAPGKKLLVMDLNAVENRVLGWMTRCQAINEVFEQGRCPYLSFATRMYKLDYDELERRYEAHDEEVVEMRQNSKPPVLGCFGAETPVLTDRGWVPIVSITSADKVFDGLQFVENNGTIYQGRKAVMDLFGVHATSDHLVQTSENEWRTAWDFLHSSRYEKQGLDLAFGSLWNLYATATTGSIAANVVDAGRVDLWTETIWREEKQSPVSLVRMNESAWKQARFTIGLTNREASLIDWRIVIMPSHLDAEGREILHIATQAEEYNVNSRMFTNSLNMRLAYLATTTPNSRLTEQITTETTPRATFASFLQKLTTATRKFFSTLSGTENKCQRSSSGNNTVLSTETAAPFVGNFEKVYDPNRSLPNKHVAVVPTFDILNAGPRNRYMILTQRGPLIVHNCGYQLSGGEEKINEDGDKIYTGLMGYARNMGVEMSQEFAHDSVGVFRGVNTEVVDFWSNSQEAAIKAIREGVTTTIGPLTFIPHKGLLQMVLPSGRPLNYIRPKIEKDEKYDREGVTYEGKQQGTGQWVRIKGYGGKWTEQSDQGIARDLLVEGMFNAEKIGLPIVSHTHDELVCEVDKDSKFALDDLRACMIKSPAWASDLILAADGFEGEYYRK